MPRQANGAKVVRSYVGIKDEHLIILYISEVPSHLKNVRSVIAKTFHENENYQSSMDVYFLKKIGRHIYIDTDIDSGVDDSTNSGDSLKRS